MQGAKPMKFFITLSTYKAIIVVYLARSVEYTHKDLEIKCKMYEFECKWYIYAPPGFEELSHVDTHSYAVNF
jgi:hypothetical protein